MTSVQVLALLLLLAATATAASSRRAAAKDAAADVISGVSLDRPHTQRLLRRQLQELERQDRRPRPGGRDRRRYALGGFGGGGLGGASLGGASLGGGGLGGASLGGGGLGGGFGPLVLSPSLIDTSSLGSTGHQPRTPVYHATPLQPFGALLPSRPAEEPKPIEEEQLEDHEPPPAAVAVPAPASHGQEHSPAAASYQNAEYKIVEPAYRHQLHHDEDEGHGQYAAKYQFGYQVRDPKTGSYFGHTESRSGHLTKGHYHVLLPDGRLQNVQYWADPSGYHAQVSFNGVAKHPPSSNSAHNHAPAPLPTLAHPGYGYGAALKRVAAERKEGEAQGEGDQR
ncbi:pro-resilin-like [Schistocerca gregaria]|uniref:pro-resilin-like n=1 Tax=Schistocerca gregaria TaxID=7010 RepID=UPI00211EEBDE|nr:pro-resilin-like [Schistocerca gregaria]